jgi:hypothetical protein
MFFTFLKAGTHRKPSAVATRDEDERQQVQSSSSMLTDRSNAAYWWKVCPDDISGA